MPTIQAQLEWEEQMVTAGIERYRKQQDAAIEGGRAHETSAGSRLLRSYIMPVSNHIKSYLSGELPDRRRSSYARLIETVDTDKVALFALKTIINTTFNPMTIQKVAVSIGTQVEDELRFSKFQEEHKEYYDEIVRSWERKNTSSYRHKRTTLAVKSRDQGMQWDQWPHETLFRVGALIIALVMEVSDLARIERVPGKGQKPDVYIVPTAECSKWVMDHNELAELIKPDKMPCIIPPADWISPNDGGFYSAPMRKRTPLVKIMRGSGGAVHRRLLDEADLSPVYEALNAMQATGWRVNTRIMQTMREVWHKNLGIGMPRSQPYEFPTCPLPAEVKPWELPDEDPRKQAFIGWKADMREMHSLEKERVSKNLSVARTIRTANAMEKFDAFYFVYTCDFRGRVYAATSGLSPQGTDHGKGLLEFAEAKPLGPHGFYWLKVHGANKWGEDKSSYDARVQWIEDRHEHWIACAADPIGNSSIWSRADKPYQFLAFCFEYAEAHRLGDAFRSRLPIALDGSCNGLQHFSAMLRDEVGGKAVNLVPGDKPEDIYQEVADVCTRKLKGLRMLHTEEAAGAANWMEAFKSNGDEGMPRKLSKTPVMTLPYGSTQQACTGSIYKWAIETIPDFFPKSSGFRHALYLSPRLWSSISEVVIAARAAMDWIQNVAGKLAKEGHPIQYTTPLGFPVHQAIHNYTTKKIETQIGGRLQLRFARNTDKLNSRKQRQGSSPNFVHSIDATHMLMCVREGAKQGITSFAMIHDDFGVHACDTVLWHTIIREQFVKLHSETNLLEKFKTEHEELFGVELDDVPASGSLDIQKVKDSPYFFG